MTPLKTICGLAVVCRLLAGEWIPTRIEAPIYPPVANQARIQGVVKLKLGLSADGGVVTVDVISGHPALAKAAKANALMWRFAAPCTCDGTPPPSVELTYEFQLLGEVAARPTTRFRYEHPYKVFVLSQAVHWEPGRQSPKR